MIFSDGDGDAKQRLDDSPDGAFPTSRPSLGGFLKPPATRVVDYSNAIYGPIRLPIPRLSDNGLAPPEISSFFSFDSPVDVAFVNEASG